jgi:acyl-coenzyme A synthetase/AMP-(fatty) acid ligase
LLFSPSPAERGKEPKGELLFSTMVADDPLYSPVCAGKAAEALLEQAKLPFDNVACFEFNEAFAVIDVLFSRSYPHLIERYIDQDGHFILQGRKDDLVNINGFKVSIAHIERVLLSVEGVSDAAVYAHTDANQKTKLVAVVVSQLSKREILSQLQEQLFRLEVPTRIVFQTSIPHNQAGKPDYEKLRLHHMPEDGHSV